MRIHRIALWSASAVVAFLAADAALAATVPGDDAGRQPAAIQAALTNEVLDVEVMDSIVFGGAVESELMPLFEHWATNPVVLIRRRVSSYLSSSNYQSEAAYRLRLELTSDPDENGTGFLALRSLSTCGPRGHEYLTGLLTNESAYRRGWAATFLVEKHGVSKKAMRLAMDQVVRDGTINGHTAAIFIAGGAEAAWLADDLLALRHSESKVAQVLAGMGAATVGKYVDRLATLDPGVQFTVLCAVEELAPRPGPMLDKLERTPLGISELDRLRIRILQRLKPPAPEGTNTPSAKPTGRAVGT